MKTERGYLSIGEVLDTLKGHFPDVSVSKIRFLESEGLITPERTPSGYRKFHGPDVERLRIILTMQRDSFLPLKVIRERLRALDAGQISVDAVAAPAPAAAPSSPEPSLRAVPAPQPAKEDELAEPASVRLTGSDLAHETGLDPKEVKALQEFGVLCVHGENGTDYFDGNDLQVGKLARALLQLGFDARHLRTLRRSAEQEADLFGQLVSPVMRNRRPEAREEAADTLSELARLSRQLRQAYVRQSLRATLGGEK